MPVFELYNNKVCVCVCVCVCVWGGGGGGEEGDTYIIQNSEKDNRFFAKRAYSNWLVVFSIIFCFDEKQK